MRRLLFAVIGSVFLFYCSSAQLTTQLKIPFSTTDNKVHNVSGYYHPGVNEIIINGQEDDSTITHFFYDTSFLLKRQYSVFSPERTILYRRGKQFLVGNIFIQHTILEVYASADSIAIFKLNSEASEDKKMATIILGQVYEKEKFVAIMPDEYGCRFLTVSTKKKKAIIYRWLFSTNLMSISEVELPQSTLSKEEIREHDGSFLEVKYKDIFSDVSVDHINKPGIFQFPSESQLFYNDSCIYFVNKTAFEAGINIFKINTRLGTASSKNYLINKVESDKGSKDLAHPVATLYDTLLIIQNWSLKSFEYYFYNLLTGELIAKYQTKPDNSLYSLVHSPLKQVGDIASKNAEKEIENEKRFTKNRNAGLPFIKPALYKDSLVLTFGSMIPTKGIAGMIVNMATFGIASVGEIAFRISLGSIVDQMLKKRFILLYAHSKFSAKDLKPSSANNVHTSLDDFIEDKNYGEVKTDNSILIDVSGKPYVGIFDKQTGTYGLHAYVQIPQ